MKFLTIWLKLCHALFSGKEKLKKSYSTQWSCSMMQNSLKMGMKCLKLCHIPFAEKESFEKNGSGHWSCLMMQNSLKIEMKCLTIWLKLCHVL